MDAWRHRRGSFWETSAYGSAHEPRPKKINSQVAEEDCRVWRSRNNMRV